MSDDTPAPPSLLSGFLTEDQIATELQVTPRTIKRWTAEPGGLPHAQIGRRKLYPRDGVLAWLNGRVRGQRRHARP